MSDGYCAETGKEMLSKADAKSMAAGWRAQRGASKMDAYRCPECSSWHIGNSRDRHGGRGRRGRQQRR